MNIFSSRAGRFSFAAAFADAHFRAGLYLWLLIAGACVLLANMVGGGA